MLGQQILQQLPKITAISFVKNASILPLQRNLADKLPNKITRLLKVPSTRSFFVSSHLEKYNRKSGSQDLDSDSEDESSPQFKDERDSKVIKAKVNSLRADLLLKAGLSMARNKVENIFYESRIRVNGNKLNKKSIQLNEGDEIDVIRGFSQQNPSHLVISRVIILSASEREEGYSVNLRRYKGLLVENYSGTNAFKSSSVFEN